MGGWVDGWMGRRVDGWEMVDGWMGGWMGRWMIDG
jgi:hypothetical protein